MKTIETIDSTNIDRLEVIGSALADSYKIAFAGEPWNEVSRCINTDCPEQFTCQEPGNSCLTCNSLLVEAYDSKELVDAWRQMVANDRAIIETTLNRGQVPILATIARPTNPDELFERKYADIEAMRPWLRRELPPVFVWIEDTFANRKVSPSGNLVGRGATLGRIATRYSGLMIATRTLTPAIVGATLRDVGTQTQLSLGSQTIDVEQARLLLAREIGNVPDRRSFLRVMAREEMG